MQIRKVAIIDTKEQDMHDKSHTKDPELDLPMASGIAFQAAGFEAIAKCDPIIESFDGKLCGFFPDGTRRVIGSIKPPTTYPPDTKIDLL